MKYTPRLPDTNVNVTPVSPLREFFVLFTGLIGAMTGLYLILGLAVDWIAPRLSPELEQKLVSPFLHALANADRTSDKIQPVQTLLNSIAEMAAGLILLSIEWVALEQGNRFQNFCHQSVPVILAHDKKLNIRSFLYRLNRAASFKSDGGNHHFIGIQNFD